ncbi:MAG TPA: hypothetical protein VEH09_01375, partial [Thermodesulfobacteriota bacterium]|nr:hypothetical protein [Thermodesulfobacteriota bacterium]
KISVKFLLTGFFLQVNMSRNEWDGSFGKHIRWPLGELQSPPMAFFVWPDDILTYSYKPVQKGGISQ